ncbi:torsin-1A [Cephus cinctus]|uniref:Torsin-1A n=1 Tax=Cephus cinctus TaxID=211228 RepID=A0AAJ7BYC4_CEPCN|nr:torsin-1A [Cephus cinctus]
MKIIILLLNLCILLIHGVECILPLIPIGVGFTGAGIAGYSYLKCRIFECCDEKSVPADLTLLNKLLTEQLYGQQIAHETVLNALRGHFHNHEPPKPLALSFHGLSGSGKNYVVSMIAKALYQKGEQSEHYHFFNGRIDFPLERKVQEYREQLLQHITEALNKCDKSLFVFDEVDKMPEGLLNVLVPLLDYQTTRKGVNRNKAIYVFLSNTGSVQIVKRLLELWEAGKRRESMTLQDFENLIAIGAFNERGGFHKSDTIETSVIDHYVPFLPLEEVHVIRCVEFAFKKRGVTPTSEMVDEIMTHVTYGPEPHKLYSKAGCKRLEQKVASLVYRKKKREVETKV